MIKEITENNSGKSCLCVCDICGKEFARKYSHATRTQNQFCSSICKGKFRKGKSPSLETRTKMGVSRSGEKAYNWKGGLRITSGRFYVKASNHPHVTKEGYIARSRFVMEDFIGRYLLPREVIHHINGDKTDDRIENLMLFKNGSDHAKFHMAQIIRDKFTGRFLSFLDKNEAINFGKIIKDVRVIK